MPVELKTCENGHVQHYIVTDPWRVSDFTSLFDEDRAYRDGVPFKVHSLVDLTRSTQAPPPGIIAVRFGSPTLEHPRRGIVVAVGLNKLTRIMSGFVLWAAGMQAENFETLDEGWAALRAHLAEHPE